VRGEKKAGPHESQQVCAEFFSALFCLCSLEDQRGTREAALGLPMLMRRDGARARSEGKGRRKERIEVGDGFGQRRRHKDARQRAARAHVLDIGARLVQDRADLDVGRWHRAGDRKVEGIARGHERGQGKEGRGITRKDEGFTGTIFGAKADDICGLPKALHGQGEQKDLLVAAQEHGEIADTKIGGDDQGAEREAGGVDNHQPVDWGEEWRLGPHEQGRAEEQEGDDAGIQGDLEQAADFRVVRAGHIGYYTRQHGWTPFVVR
jgi:hypothetical protein